MAKFAGSVGYVTETETNPGVWTSTESIRSMRGDILRTASTTQGTDQINKDPVLQHRISLLGDAYAFANFYNIRWIMFKGVKWDVTLIEVNRPRIVVTLGGRYNG